jgi:hypothetical protein
MYLLLAFVSSTILPSLHFDKIKTRHICFTNSYGSTRTWNTVNLINVSFLDICRILYYWNSWYDDQVHYLFFIQCLRLQWMYKMFHTVNFRCIPLSVTLYDVQIVIEAFVLTIATTVALTLYTFQSKRDFSSWGAA